jgi:hypothetical protein
MGCFAHVTSTVEVDGRSFSSTWCGSGAPRGFAGVELVDAIGRRLRLAQHLDGTAAVAYFPAGSAIGEDLPVCAAVDIRPGAGTINGTRNLDGTATFSCATDRHRIVGAVQFENCH